jgi:hypothetical protein
MSDTPEIAGQRTPEHAAGRAIMVPTDNSPQCIITGCILHDQDHERWVNGDLFQSGDTYIHFANIGGEGGIDWTKVEPRGTPKIIRLGFKAPYLINERRGVIIVQKAQAVFNHEAWLYTYKDRL